MAKSFILLSDPRTRNSDGECTPVVIRILRDSERIQVILSLASQAIVKKNAFLKKKKINKNDLNVVPKYVIYILSRKLRELLRKKNLLSVQIFGIAFKAGPL